MLDEGAVIFIPEGTKYRTRALPDGDVPCEGIGITFDMIEKRQTKLTVDNNIYYDWNSLSTKVKDAFFTLSEIKQNSPADILSVKTVLFRLLHSLLSSELSYLRNNKLIKPAISFIADHYKENLPVSEYAKQCNLSESYFRKLFLESMGMSPLDYRNELRFFEAKRMYQNNHTLHEIAEAVGFTDAGYLSKLYKKHTGSTIKKDSKTV